MLQTTGPISLSDVGDEFHSDKPIKISDYYGLYGLPAFGAIALSDFYGKTYYTLDLYVSDKTYYVYVGKTTTISISYILDGIYEIENPDNSFILEGAFDPINGSVELNETYIVFTSTGHIGEEASFNVALRDESGYMALVSISITVIEEPVSSPSITNDCIIDEIIGINEIIGQEPSLICKILTE